MTKIEIKKGNLDKVSEDLKVDLRNQPVEIEQPLNKWLFLSIFLCIVVLALSIGWYFSVFQKSNFIGLIPEQAVVFSLIDQQALYRQVSPLNHAVINKLAGYFSQADLDFKDINSFFKEQIAFILMPDNSKDLFPFLLILENKEKLSEFNQVLDRIELELKHDYNVSFKTYRQSEITILEPLSSSLATNSYVYAQVGNYLIISNSYQSLVLMVDLVINN